MKYRNFVFECTKEVASTLKETKNSDLEHLVSSYVACQNNKLSDVYSHARKLSGKMFGLVYQDQLIQESTLVNRISSGSGPDCKLWALYYKNKDKTYVLNQQGIVEEISGLVHLNKAGFLENDKNELLSCIPLVEQKVITDTDHNVKILYQTYSNNVKYLGPDTKTPGVKQVDGFLPTNLEANNKLSLEVTENNIQSSPQDDSVEKWEKEALQDIKSANPMQLYKDLNRIQNVFRNIHDTIQKSNIEQLNMPQPEERKEFLQDHFKISAAEVDKIAGLGQTLGNAYIPILKDWLQLSLPNESAPIPGSNCLLKHYQALTQESASQYSYEHITTGYIWAKDDNAFILNEKGGIQNVSSDFLGAKIINIDQSGLATLQYKYKGKEKIIENTIKCRPLFQIEGKSTLTLSHKKDDIKAIETKGKLEISISSQTPALKYNGPEKSSIIVNNTLPKAPPPEDKLKESLEDLLESSFSNISEIKGSLEEIKVERLSIAQLHATYRLFQPSTETQKEELKNATFKSAYIPNKITDANQERTSPIHYNFSRNSSEGLSSTLLFEPVTVGKNEEKGACCLDDVLKAIRERCSPNNQFRAIVPIAEVVEKGYLYLGHRHYVTLVIDNTKEGMVARIIDSKGAAAALGSYMGYNREKDITQKLTEHAKVFGTPLTMKSRKHLGIQAIQDNIRCGYYTKKVSQYLLENDRIDKLTPEDISVNESSFNEIHASVINEGMSSVVQGVLKSQKEMIELEEKEPDSSLQDSRTLELIKWGKALTGSETTLDKDVIQSRLTKTKMLYSQFNEVCTPSGEHYQFVHDQLAHLEALTKGNIQSNAETIRSELKTLGSTLQRIALVDRFDNATALTIQQFNEGEIDFWKHEKELNVFMENLNFSKKTIGNALEILMKYITSPKEPEKLEFLLKAFAKNYHNHNPETDEALCYRAVFAIAKLDTKKETDKMPRGKTLTKTYQSSSSSSATKEENPKDTPPRSNVP